MFQVLARLLFIFPALLTTANQTFIPIDDIAPILADWAKPKYSPDETHFAYLAPDERRAYNICVDGTFITHEKRAISDFYWEPDNQHLLYLYDEQGDEFFHLYRVDLKGNRVDLTPYKNTCVNLVSLSEKRPGEALIVSTHEHPSKNFYLINLITKELTPFLPQRDDLCVFEGSEDLKPLAAVSFRPDGRNYLEIYKDGTWDSIWELSSEDRTDSPFLHVTSNQKLLIRARKDLKAEGLYEIDLKTYEKRLIFAHPKLDLVRAYFDPKTNALQAALVRYDQIEWHCFDTAFEAEIKTLYERLPKGEIILESRIAKDRKWLIVHRRDDCPNAYYLWDRDQQELKLVLQEAPHLLQYPFGKMKSFSFLASDGLEIQGYLLTPPYGEGPYPTILYPHGGPNYRDSFGFYPRYQFLANRGYALLFVNYRGSIGFGTNLLVADTNEWGRRNYQDILEAKNWAIEQGMVDPKRVAMAGASFGGYLTLLGMTLNPNDFVCGIAEVPLVHPKSWRFKDSLPHFAFWDPCIEIEVKTALSPVDYAQHLKAPLLIVHSENDLRVPLSQSQQMVKALQSYEIPFKYHIFSGDGHIFLDPDNRRQYYFMIEEFLSKHMPIK